MATAMSQHHYYDQQPAAPQQQQQPRGEHQLQEHQQPQRPPVQALRWNSFDTSSSTGDELQAAAAAAAATASTDDFYTLMPSAQPVASPNTQALAADHVQVMLAATTSSPAVGGASRSLPAAAPAVALSWAQAAPSPSPAPAPALVQAPAPAAPVAVVVSVSARGRPSAGGAKRRRPPAQREARQQGDRKRRREMGDLICELDRLVGSGHASGAADGKRPKTDVLRDAVAKVLELQEKLDEARQQALVAKSSAPAQPPAAEARVEQKPPSPSSSRSSSSSVVDLVPARHRLTAAEREANRLMHESLTLKFMGGRCFKMIFRLGGTLIAANRRCLADFLRADSVAAISGRNVVDARIEHFFRIGNNRAAMNIITLSQDPENIRWRESLRERIIGAVAAGRTDEGFEMDRPAVDGDGNFKQLRGCVVPIVSESGVIDSVQVTFVLRPRPQDLTLPPLTELE